MVGKSVLVLANLKDRTMVGVKSQGMVLCACNADHSKVTLLEIPSNAKPGDRVTFKGFEGEPASSSVVAKKKILEGIAPFLVTSDDGVCCFKDIPFVINGNTVNAILKNAIVS
jgi:tRNA-binding EMAP/Myf-like protein